MPSYQEPQQAKIYLDFLNSTNGQIQKNLLLEAIYPLLPQNKAAKILDAGCGNGWLAGMLKNKFSNILGCDSSKFLIGEAQKNYPTIEFKVADLQKALPYPEFSFDSAILNMAGPDIDNLPEAFKNINKILKPFGELLMTIPNPEYSYPAAVWKRSLVDRLFFRKPKLLLKKNTVKTKKITREFGKGKKIDSNYYSLKTYLQSAQLAGFQIAKKQEIKSLIDSKHFDLNYQLFRYPLLLILKFQKLR